MLLQNLNRNPEIITKLITEMIFEFNFYRQNINATGGRPCKQVKEKKSIRKASEEQKILLNIPQKKINYLE